MLEDATLQKQVADALSVSVKKMKKSKGMLEGVEKLSDDAAEMRDISEDVQNALASIAESTNDPSLDDDDLMEELEAMAAKAPSEEYVSFEKRADDAVVEGLSVAYPAAPTSTMPATRSESVLGISVAAA